MTNNMEKLYIDSRKLLEDSYHLAWQVYESGFKPNYIVGIWRGGAPVGIAVQELLHVLGISSDHIAIRPSSYISIGKRSKKVSVYGLNYVIKKLESEDSLLIVDDVFDTGLSVNQVIKNLKKACKKNTPNIKIATPYYKPSNNKTEIEPDFYIHKSNKWLVFPHELEGLNLDEIKKNKPEMNNLVDKIASLK